jgi:hypothetical protein
MIIGIQNKRPDMVIGHLDGMIAGIHNMRQVMINLKA